MTLRSERKTSLDGKIIAYNRNSAKLKPSLGCRIKFFLAPASLLQPPIEALFLGRDVIRHHSITFLYFFVAALDHGTNNDIGLRIELVELHPQVLGVLGDVDFGLLCRGRLLFLLDEIESVGIGKKRSEFFLEVIRFPGVFVNVVLDGNLGSKRITRYISLSCFTRSMLYVSTNSSCISSSITFCAKLAGKVAFSSKNSLACSCFAFSFSFSLSAFLKNELNINNTGLINIATIICWKV